ncbi:MAG: glycosyltransferase family 39 protein [Chloroflexi bacterium]|nr:glycosyltransferase family 39 protein [Chloroflexota bacterium]
MQLSRRWWDALWRVSWFRPGRGTAVVLGLLLVLALGLRLYGINWDQGGLFHPDERFILWCASDLGQPASYYQQGYHPCGTAAAPWNPHWFAYGSFPLYVLKAAGAVQGWLGSPPSLYELRLAGRVLSALFDTATVLLVFILGWRLWGRGVGLLAAGLVAATVLHVQLSHFYAVDTLLTLLVMATLLGCWWALRSGRTAASALVGVAFGLALATKVSAAPLAAAIVAAHAAYALTDPAQPRVAWSPSAARLQRALLGLGIAGATALAALFVAQPYGFLDWPRFLRDVVEQSEMVRRVRDYPYTRQYVDTAPYIYHLRQLAIWGLGPVLGAAAGIGVLLALWRGLVRREKGDLLLLAWTLPYFLIVGAFEVKFLRYMLPITPVLALWAARALVGATAWARRQTPAERGRLLQRWAVGITVLVVASAAFYALAYASIYSRPHPAQAMARWISQSVPPGAAIAVEHWEERLPRLEPRYRLLELPLYDRDSPQKLDLLAARLAEADYLVFYSQRLYGTIPRLPQRYPDTARYYQALFQGDLGFDLARYELSSPSLFGVTIVEDPFGRSGLPVPGALASYQPSWLTVNGGFADESFSVYDHPPVLLFAKAQRFTPEELRARLEAGAAFPGEGAALHLTRTEASRQQAGGTWSRLFDRASLANRFPTGTWLMTFELISLALLPLGLMLFQGLADRGFLLSKVLAVLLFSYAAWLPPSLHWLPFTRTTMVLVLLVLAGVSAAVYWSRRHEINSFARSRWRLLLFEEAVFLGVFAIFWVLRSANPDLWHPFRGGEKPMDFAYLNAVIKSTWMPPFDPWFAGGALNYYYFGQFTVAAMVKLTGVVPAVAFNLAVPWLAALAAAGAFTVAFNLAALVRRARSQGARGGTGLPLALGTLAVLAVVLLGNLDGAAQLAQGLMRTLDGFPFGPFDYWRSSRLIQQPDCLPPAFERCGFEITEFPYFSFLFADLHAHLLALPYALFALGAALALVAGAGGPFLPRGQAQQRAAPFTLTNGALLAVLALAIGALRATNSWDYPTALLLAAGAVLLAEWARRGDLALPTWFWALLKVALVYLLAQLLFRPYLLHNVQFYDSLERSRWVTPLYQYLGVHGLFIAVLLLYLLRELAGQLARSQSLRELLKAARLPGPALGIVEAPARPWLDVGSGVLPWSAYACVAAVGALYVLLWRQEATAAFLLLLLALLAPLAWQELARPRPDSHLRLAALGMAGLALGLGLGVEWFTIEGDINRQNTVFKFYLQAWDLLAVSTAFLLGTLLFPDRAAGPAPARWPRLMDAAWRGLCVAAIAILAAAAIVYPVAATPERVRDRFATDFRSLDGMSFMARAVYTQDPKGPIDLRYDYQALLWMQDHIPGSPVVLEGITPLYRWGNRVAVYTGLPAVIGWDWHQKQQRWLYQREVEARRAAVDRMYSTPDQEQALALLRQYQVQYIYVGQLERNYYPASGLVKFEAMVGLVLEEVYRNPQVTIYRVKS